MEFVAARLPGDWILPAEDVPGLANYLEWAECNALVANRATAAEPLRRTDWWRMMARVACDPRDCLPADADSLRGVLIEDGLLPESTTARGAGTPDWRELARDLARLREIGWCVGAVEVEPTEHRATCRSRLGTSHPASHPRELGDRTAGTPSLLDACLLLGDLSLENSTEPTADTGHSDH